MRATMTGAIKSFFERNATKPVAVFTAASAFAIAAVTFNLPLLAIELGVGFLLVAFATLSFQARRVQPAAIAIGSLVAFVIFNWCVSLSWLNLWQHGSQGFITRSDANRVREANLIALKRIEVLLKPLSERISNYVQPAPQSRTGHMKPEPAQLLFEVPITRGIPGPAKELNRLESIDRLRKWMPGPDARVTFASVDRLSPEKLPADDQIWPLYHMLLVRRTELSVDSDVLASAQGAPIPEDVRADLVRTAPALSLWFTLWAAVNLVFAGLGWLFELPKQIRRRLIT